MKNGKDEEGRNDEPKQKMTAKNRKEKERGLHR
jgi:hypothetical protein